MDNAARNRLQLLEAADADLEREERLRSVGRVFLLLASVDITEEDAQQAKAQYPIHLAEDA
jgi:hypothetical protein